MFNNLADKLDSVFKKLKGRGRLTAEDIDATLREVRLALLEADVNFKVVKDFLARIRERAVGDEVSGSLTPAQQVIKIVHGELAGILGGSRAELAKADVPPTRILMVGLQGSGKTTTCAKLALHLKEQGLRPYLIPADLSRPAAVDQLVSVAGKVGVPVFPSDISLTPVEVYRQAAVAAGRAGCDTLIVDTAGRLHVDDDLMAEASALSGAVHPHETLLVADSMTGQDAVQVAESFHSKLKLTGIILTKLDGDARGGAALSMRHITGVPIKFAGIGEGMGGLEAFYPDRIASRILGMGDVMTLIDKAEKAFDEKEAAKLARKTRKGDFDLADFRDQLKKVKEMGSMQEILSMLPLPGKMKNAMPAEMDDRELVKVTAIIDSMTLRERQHPKIINGSRRKRISTGSGTTVTDVNRLLKQFDQAKKMMKRFGKGGRGPMGGMKMPF